MKRSVRQTGVLKCLFFLKRQAWELAIEGSRLDSLWCSLLEISFNNLIDKGVHYPFPILGQDVSS